jgi:8-oxo-dGTP diphosphatase
MKRSYSAALRFEDKLLIVQRAADEDFLPNYWELPGGGAEPEETGIEALQREIDEEIGYTFKAGEVAHPYYYFTYGERKEETHFMVWVAEHITPKLNPAEHQEFMWASREDVLRVHMSDILRESCLMALKMKRAS